MNQFINPPDGQIRALLERVRTIAVVGFSPRSDRPSHRAASQRRRFGYRIIPVRPAVEAVLEERAYACVEQVPEKIDLVDVFCAPAHVGGILDSCIALKLPVLWLQDGVIDESAAARARAAGIQVVMDRCAYRDYLRWFASS